MESIGPHTLAARTNRHTLLDESLGPLFLGTVLYYCLGGIQIAQSYYYYRSYRNTDNWFMKVSVALLILVGFCQTVTITHACWIFFVDGWGDVEKITFHPGWGFWSTPIMDATNAFVVHMFYAHKIWVLLDSPLNVYATLLVVSLSLTQWTGGIGCSARMYAMRMTLLEFPRVKTWATVWLVTAAVTDIVITVIMTMKLSRSRTGFKKSDDMISKLIRIMIETGLATALVQIADIVIYLLWPLKAYHFIASIIGPKVYSNSMLALLNSRESRKGTMISWHTTSQDRMPDNIHVHTSQTVAIDNYEMDDGFKSSMHGGIGTGGGFKHPAPASSFLPPGAVKTNI